MLLLVSIELLKFARGSKGKEEILSMAMTVAVSLATNMAYGFAAGLAAHRALTYGRKNE
jgi:hypothetical protein